MNVANYIGKAIGGVYSDTGTSNIYGTRTGSETNTSSAGAIDRLVQRHGNELFGTILDKILSGIGSKFDQWAPEWLKNIFDPSTKTERVNSGMFHKYGDTGQNAPVNQRYGEMDFAIA
ncbi:MAG: hypothetical protein JW754_03570 [Candidatus Aenigmarchaeota archaeon]|nr:hypothetical protein [Candidatus Aenigmarchaeota archaeon]